MPSLLNRFIGFLPYCISSEEAQREPTAAAWIAFLLDWDRPARMNAMDLYRRFVRRLSPAQRARMGIPEPVRPVPPFVPVILIDPVEVVLPEPVAPDAVIVIPDDPIVIPDDPIVIDDDSSPLSSDTEPFESFASQTEEIDESVHEVPRPE